MAPPLGPLRTLLAAALFAAGVINAPIVSGQGSGSALLGSALGIPMFKEWTASEVYDATELDDPDACYFALLTGPACIHGTESGVYKITPQWYTGHYGGTYRTSTNGCGNVIESWTAKHAMVSGPFGTTHPHILHVHVERLSLPHTMICILRCTFKVRVHATCAWACCRMDFVLRNM